MDDWLQGLFALNDEIDLTLARSHPRLRALRIPENAQATLEPGLV